MNNKAKLIAYLENFHNDRVGARGVLSCMFSVAVGWWWWWWWFEVGGKRWWLLLVMVVVALQLLLKKKRIFLGLLSHLCSVTRHNFLLLFTYGALIALAQKLVFIKNVCLAG